MTTTIQNEKSNILVMLFPLILTLMPRPNIPGIHFLTYPVIAFILVCLLLSMGKKLNFDKNYLLVAGIIYSFSLAIGLSSLFNVGDFPFSSTIEMFKPILFLIIMTYGYAVGLMKKGKSIEKGLLKSAYIILTVQIIVGFTQLFNINVFNWIYNAEKATGLGGILRLSGTLANPNFFAWIVIQMAILIYVFEKKSMKRLFWMLLALSLLVLSGSRSSLVMFPAIMFMLNFFLTKKNLNFYFKKLPLMFTGLFLSVLGAYWFILKFGAHFPYLNQLLLIVESGSLDSINSFDMRLNMWNNGLEKIDGSFITSVFGLGPGSVNVLDNDYLYAIVNYGFLGLIVNLLIYASLFIVFSKIKQRNFGAIGKTYILFSMLIGLQADTLIGWNYPLLIMFYTGIAISFYRQRHEYEEQEVVTFKIKKSRKRYKIVW